LVNDPPGERSRQGAHAFRDRRTGEERLVIARPHGRFEGGSEPAGKPEDRGTVVTNVDAFVALSDPDFETSKVILKR
jgi:hypothetical protein